MKTDKNSRILSRSLEMEEISNDQFDHEVKSALQIEEAEQPRIDTSPSLHRSPNTLTTDGKSFGSMNLEEFINSIWTEEEAQAQNANSVVPTAEASSSLNNMNPQYHFGQTPNGSSDIARQMSLTRPGSQSVPAPSCQKIVDVSREPSDGEMTFYEFLVKIGVLREEGAIAQIPPPRLLYQLHPPAPPFFQPRPAPPLLPRPQLPYGSVDVPTPFGPQATSFYGVASGVRGSENIGEMGAVSLDEIGLNNRGQKRIIEGPSEMMIERYEKKLIRNREAATKSRAKKQARTREFEAQLNHLKQENSCLAERLQLETKKNEAQKKAKEKRGTLRRTLSCPH
ncbi:protein ABSCISIC ACID-INSENSITIVE 5-like [Apium graveolens]|uniref:protein ABSCISIC ACID-INSENSITIVE 5-like n=1 Tax=Apium graveolens TaxID=4045 RepID=UPI003D7BFEC9